MITSSGAIEKAQKNANEAPVVEALSDIQLRAAQPMSAITFLTSTISACLPLVSTRPGNDHPHPRLARAAPAAGGNPISALSRTITMTLTISDSGTIAKIAGPVSTR